MNSRDYWAEREAEALKDYITEEKEYSKRINEIYEETLQGIQSEIDAFYRKYATDNKISLREAKKRVRKLDIAEYERKAKRYVKNKDFSKKANEEMRIYNLTMKINRLEMLKANIGLEQLKGASKLERFFYKILNRRALKEYERQAGILGKSVRDNAKLAHAVVNASFRGMYFSDRIWTNSAAMKADLDRLITTGLIRGKNPRVLAREMRKHVIGGEGAVGAKYHAERLMRTELARVQTEAQKQSMEENGFELYQFFVNGGCCSACEEVAKKKTKYGTGVYRIKDLQPGLNAAPIHPNCRCSIAPYEDSDEYKAWLDFLDKGGTTEEWKKQNAIAKNRENGIIKSRNISERRMANGLRISPYHVLSDEEIESIKKDAKELNIPENILRFNQGNQTGFLDEKEVINIRGDILPDKLSNNMRDILSSKAVLAHEYYGHYKNHPSQFKVGDWRDEFRASYCAALNTPKLSDEERRMLMLDAYDRAKEAGVSIKYNKKARRLIYGYDD